MKIRPEEFCKETKREEFRKEAKKEKFRKETRKEEFRKETRKGSGPAINIRHGGYCKAEKDEGNKVEKFQQKIYEHSSVN